MSIIDTPSIGKSKAVSEGYVAPCTYSKIRSEGKLSIPAGCLLRTNSSMPASPDGIMTSVLSSFGLAAWALGLANTLPRARHAKARQKELVGIKTSLDCFVLEPLGGGFSRWGWSTTLY